MKTILVILITFIVVMATTLLLDIEFISNKLERRLIVDLFILIELLIGYLFFKQVISFIQKK